MSAQSARGLKIAIGALAVLLILRRRLGGIPASCEPDSQRANELCGCVTIMGARNEFPSNEIF
jgi:hypothetical protein